jgi:hypothetical protein
MSQVASAHLVPVDRLPPLCDAGDVADFLAASTLRCLEFDCPGWFVVAAMSFLGEIGVDLREETEASKALTDRLGATCAVFTHASGTNGLALLKTTKINVERLVRHEAVLRGEDAGDPDNAIPLKAALRFLYAMLLAIGPDEAAVLIVEQRPGTDEAPKPKAQYTPAPPVVRRRRWKGLFGGILPERRHD